MGKVHILRKTETGFYNLIVNQDHGPENTENTSNDC